MTTEASPEGYLEFHADDVASSAPNLKPFVGNAAVSQFVRLAFDTMSFEEAMDNQPAIVSGDLGYIWGTYDSVFTNRCDGSRRRELGNHLFLWRRQPDDAWRLVIAVWNVTPMPVDSAGAGLQSA